MPPKTIPFGQINTSQMSPPKTIAFGANSEIPPQAQDNTYGALFPASTTDNPLVAGLKATANVPSSAFNLIKGIGQAILHPSDTLKGIGKVVVGGVEKLIPGQQSQEEAFNAFTKVLKDRYGSLENLQKTATNDPFRSGHDLNPLFTGGA